MARAARLQCGRRSRSHITRERAQHIPLRESAEGKRAVPRVCDVTLPHGHVFIPQHTQRKIADDRLPSSPFPSFRAVPAPRIALICVNGGEEGQQKGQQRR